MALTNSWPGVTGAADTTEGRKALAGLVLRDTSGNVRSGVFPRHTNAIVTARADMNVDIAAFEAVATQFGGAIFFANDGTAQLPSNLSAPVSGSYYYVVYAKQNESTAPGTDANNNVLFGAVRSASSFANARSTGTRLEGGPTGLPTGAVELATVQVPSTATATNAGATIAQTYQYTATAGSPVLVRSSSELASFAAPDGTEAIDLGTLAEDMYAKHRRIGGVWVQVVYPWTTLIAENGWTANTGTSAGLPRVARVEDRVIYQGGFFGGTPNTQCTTVPSWAYPSRTLRVPMTRADDAIGLMRIFSGGALNPSSNVHAETELEWSVL